MKKPEILAHMLISELTLPLHTSSEHTPEQQTCDLEPSPTNTEALNSLCQLIHFIDQLC